MAAAAWVMGNPTRWTLALRGGRLGRALGRKRGVIGEVPLPVVKEDRRSGLRAAAEANVPGLVAAERGGRERREELLARIATAHRSAPPPEVTYEAIERAYRTESDPNPHQLTELLVDRLLDYRALVRRCSGDDIAGTIASALSERGAGTVVVPTGLDPSWLGETQTGIRTDGVSVDQQLSVAELDATDGVITGCAVAIAETGTLILDGSVDQGRRVITLIPDYHPASCCPIRSSPTCRRLSTG